MRAMCLAMTITMAGVPMSTSAQSREYLEFNESKLEAARDFHGRKLAGCDRDYQRASRIGSPDAAQRRARCIAAADAYLQNEYRRWGDALRKRQLKN